MTIETALNKLDKLTINQLKHFIKECEKGLRIDQEAVSFLAKTVRCWKDRGELSSREIKYWESRKKKFENELKIRGYWRKI